MRRNSSITRRRKSSGRGRSENVRFDEYGFAITKRKDQKVHHRCHDYSCPPLSSVRVKELCELLSYWNGASFICKSQIERFIKLGVPQSLRGRVWKCLLDIDSLRETSHFSYQKCLLEVRGPLVDLGVSEYGILSAIATLSETQNDLGLNAEESPSHSEPGYSVDDIILFRQIALDLQRSFPTHRSLMGESPEAIEGQAKLFRVLIAYARYNPLVGYSQGMSYIAAVLLMQLGEEDAFWALTALLEKPKYLAELFDLSLNKVQHQVKVFGQFLKHRKPKLSQHLESLGVLSVHFVMPWFLTLFTSLPCWDSVLAIWDLIILHGLPAVFHTALTIIELLEPRLLELKDEGVVLPLLLRVPVDLAQYTVLVPAIWNTEVHAWELRCMDSLVLDDTHHGPKAEQSEESKDAPAGQDDTEINIAAQIETEKVMEKDSRTKCVLTRVFQLAQRYLLQSVGRLKVEGKGSQAQSRPTKQSPVPARVFRSRTTASSSFSQGRSRRRNQRGSPHQPVLQGCRVVAMETSTTIGRKTHRRSSTGPVGKEDGRHSNHNHTKSARVKSVHHLPNCKKTPNRSPSTSLRRSTSPPPSSIPTLCFTSSSAAQNGRQNLHEDTPQTALIKELSSKHQTSVPFRTAKESKLI